jgi:hypothetical protein
MTSAQYPAVLATGRPEVAGRPSLCPANIAPSDRSTLSGLSVLVRGHRDGRRLAERYRSHHLLLPAAIRKAARHESRVLKSVTRPRMKASAIRGAEAVRVREELEDCNRQVNRA